MAEPIVEARIAWMQSFPGAWFAMGRRVADAWTALEGKSP